MSKELGNKPFKRRWVSRIAPALTDAEILFQEVMTSMTEVTLLTTKSNGDGFRRYIERTLNELGEKECNFALAGKKAKYVVDLATNGIVWSAPILENVELYPVDVVRAALHENSAHSNRYQKALRERTLMQGVKPEYYHMLTGMELVEFVLAKLDKLTPECHTFLATYAVNIGFKSNELLRLVSVAKNIELLQEVRQYAPHTDYLGAVANIERFAKKI